jgi:hypothetical protein
MKILPVGAELFLSDRRTDMIKLSLFAILRKRLKIFPVNIREMVFKSETEIVYCAVRTGYLTQINLRRYRVWHLRFSECLECVADCTNLILGKMTILS